MLEGARNLYSRTEFEMECADDRLAFEFRRLPNELLLEAFAYLKPIGGFWLKTQRMRRLEERNASWVRTLLSLSLFCQTPNRLSRSFLYECVFIRQSSSLNIFPLLLNIITNKPTLADDMHYIESQINLQQRDGQRLYNQTRISDPPFEKLAGKLMTILESLRRAKWTHMPGNHLENLSKNHETVSILLGFLKLA